MPKQLKWSKRVVYLHEQPPLNPKLSAVVGNLGVCFFPLIPFLQMEDEAV